MDENNVSNIDYLNKLAAEGILKQLISRGLLPLKLNLYMEISMQIKAELKINGGKKMQAFRDVADKMNIPDPTIIRAYYSMNKHYRLPKL